MIYAILQNNKKLNLKNLKNLNISFEIKVKL